MESLGRNARLVHLKAGGDEKIHKLVLYSYLPDFACALETFRKSNDLTYDLVFSHYWLSGQVGQEVHSWWGVPHVSMFHTLGVIKNSLGVGEEEPDLRLQTEMELARGCDRIIAATEREKEVLVGLCGATPEQVAVIPCGVNPGVFRVIDRSVAREKAGFGGEKVVLFVGRIEPLKGIDCLLRGFAGLSSTLGARLVIVGGDEGSRKEIAQLQELSRELGIENAVSFLGTVKHDLMPYLYNAADVCVVPSHYESFGLVPLESLACGTPVVATDVGDLRNIIRQGENGYILPDNEPAILSEKIADVLSWPDRSVRRSRAIRASVGNLSWANVARMLSAEFERVVSESLVPVG
jgi:D-inositol-3-phosphate glycosyltransferase